MEIKGYQDRSRSSEVADSPFSAKVTPENLHRSMRNVYSRFNAFNSSGEETHYNNGEASQLSIDFVLEASGLNTEVALMPETPEPCLDQLNNFIKLCYDMNGDIHEPNFLTITWGDLVYECRLLEMDYKFDKFNQTGQPLRISVHAVFLEDVSHDERLKREGKNSPDLTHVRFVKQGDSLPALCQDVYKDADFYLKVASYNKMNHFRDLEVGQKILFPPQEELPE